MKKERSSSIARDNLIISIISSGRCERYAKTAQDLRNIMICGSGYRTPKATGRR